MFSIKFTKCIRIIAAASLLLPPLTYANQWIETKERATTTPCSLSANSTFHSSCLPRAFDPITGISLSLIIPRESDTKLNGGLLPPDFIIAAWTPLPYGFAGMGGPVNINVNPKRALEVANVGLTADWWIQAVQGSMSSVGTPVVQIFNQLSTTNALVRVADPVDAGAKIYISQFSINETGTDTSFMLFRCRNCTIQTLDNSHSSSFKLATMISSRQPVFATGDGESNPDQVWAVLPLDGKVKRGSIALDPFKLGMREYDKMIREWELL